MGKESTTEAEIAALSSLTVRLAPKHPRLHEAWRAEVGRSEPLGDEQITMLLIAMLTVTGPLTKQDVLIKVETYAVARGVVLDQTLVSVVLAAAPFLQRPDERFALGVQEVSV